MAGDEVALCLAPVALGACRQQAAIEDIAVSLAASGKQRVTLQIERLAAVGLVDAHVADQYGLLCKRTNT
jgi:hypothetical protein